MTLLQNSLPLSVRITCGRLRASQSVEHARYSQSGLSEVELDIPAPSRLCRCASSRIRAHSSACRGDAAHSGSRWRLCAPPQRPSLAQSLVHQKPAAAPTPNELSRSPIFSQGAHVAELASPRVARGLDMPLRILGVWARLWSRRHLDWPKESVAA